MGNEVVTVTVKGTGDFSDVMSKINGMQNAFNSLKLNPNLASSFNKEFSNLQKLLDDYRKAMEKPVSSKKDLKNIEALEKAINSSFSTINKLYSELNGQTILTKVDSSQLDELRQKTQAAQKAIQDAFANIHIGNKTGLSDIEGQMEKAVARSKTLKDSFQEAFSGLKSGDVSQFTKQIDNAFSNLSAKLEKNKLTTTADSLIASFKQLGLVSVDIKTENTEQRIAALKTGFEALKTAIANGVNGEELTKLVGKLDEATRAERNFLAEASKRGQDNYSKQAAGAEKLASSIRDATAAEREFKQQSFSAAQQVEQLQQSTQYFFGLRNMINLLKRGLREAFDTIKELDAAMTQTAVVTNFSVGDMWEKLPEYTANANALGASVKDMYESATLYYQQGLQGAEVMNIASETMKMARIGGLEAADATDKMTAALRGFNMELNEASAQRVNDVYSNLAAKTASDTEELGTAMQRTASIAASAGMSFEGTAAFLAQAIETTREPAENLGTAMKTIVARFQELKKNPLEISDVEGEEVDYNKVDAALKTIGVDLKDTNGQFRDLDQVFLDISQRWNSLTQTQQRYIATTAAGSRQQSRFIAMMSNYDRTMELMSYANDSSGASNEQFSKTLDSLEAKLNKFQNAWKEFLMGIMNDSWTKGIVSGATKVLDIVNKLIDVLSFDGKLKGVKSFLSLFTAFTALKMTGRGVNMLIGGLGGMLDPKSTAKEGFRGGALSGQASRISNPIVQAINGLIPHLYKATGTSMGQGPYRFQQNGDYRGARKQFANQVGLFEKNGYSVDQLLNNFRVNGLNKQQQYSFFQASPGIKKNLVKSLSGLFHSVGMSPDISKSLITGFKQGNIALDEIFNHEAFKTGTFADKYGEVLRNKGWAAARALYNEEYTKNYNKAIEGGASEKAAQAAAQKATSLSSPLNDFLQKINKPTQLERFQDTVGKAGAGLMNMGYSLQMVGSSLSATNPLLSQFVSTLGSTLTSMGSLINIIPSLMNPLTLGLGAVAAAFAIAKNQNDKIKKSAEEVTKTFTEQNKTTEGNISKLKSYQGELAQLSKGVDSNGNNVSLDDSQYQRYLEIVDDIAAINPEIVEGYNAQGHAIINNNTALAETLKLQEEIRDEAVKNYLDPEKGLQKLINARNIDKNYQASTTSYSNNDYKTGVAPLTDNVIRVAKELKKADWFDESMLESYGIHSLDSLLKGEEQAVNNFVKYQDKINAQLSEAGGDKITQDFTKSFENLGEQTELFNEAIKPVYDNLLTQVSQSPLYDSIADEFKGALQTGLKDLAAQDLSASEMSKAANNMAARFANLTTGSGKYADALKIAEDAQSKFADTLDETEYKADVQPAIDDLTRLKEEALDEGTAYGDALAEYLENQIQRISNFTKEGGANLSEALNTATDEIAAAESALDNFNEATKKDYSTASEGMKSIYDKTTETFKDSYGAEIQKHAEGMGDATFWTGAENLLSTKAIDKITSNAEDGYDAAAKVSKALKDLEPMLRDGQEGFDAFTQRVLDHSDALDKLADAGVTYDKETGLLTDIPDDQWHNVAEALGISDDLLAAMISKGRQFADISFMNIEEARKSLAASEFTIKGTSAKAGEQQKLYVKEDTLRAELANAGYVRREQQDEQIEVLKGQNVDILKSAESYEKGSKELADKFNDMGVRTLPDLIQTLNDTGDFTKDEIKDYADKAGLLGSDAQYDELYTDIIEAAENPELVKQTGVLETISAQIAALAISDNAAQGTTKKELEAANKELLGGKGVDTDAQAFAYGKKLVRDEDGNIVRDKNGNAKLENLTAGEYEETKKSMQAVADSYRETAAIAEAKAKTATGEDKKYWEDVQKSAEEGATRADKYLQMADKAKAEQAEKEQKEKEGRQKEIEARNKSREAERKQKEEEEKKKAADKKAADDLIYDYRNKPKQLTEAEKEAKREVKENEGRQKEIEARNQSSPSGLISSLLQQDMDLSLKEAIGNLNAAEIASDPQKTMALSNLYKDVMEGSLPTNQDLQQLGILDQWNIDETQSKASEYINGWKDFLTSGGLLKSLDFSSTIDALTEADKTAYALEALGGADNVNKAITWMGQRLKTWWDKLNGLNTEADSNLSTTPSQPSSQASQATSGVAKGATSSITEAVTKFTSVGQEEVEDSIDTIQTKAEQGANLNVKATQDNSLTIAQNAINQLKSVTSSGVTLKTNTSDIDNAAKAPVSKPVNIQDNATPKIKKIDDAAKKSVTKTINISPHYTGTWQHSVYLSATGPGAKATGQNNKISYTHVPQAGSAARGYGKLGPKGKGGMTLTGELGYEIAWLPSENRSMILGAHGPQMVNLPANAVVWTHEQSKKIMKQKSIPAGSHAYVQANGYQRKYSATSVSGGTSASNSTAKTVQKTSKAVQKSAEDAGKAVGKVSVWWENIARKTEVSQRNMDKSQKAFENYIKEMRSTLKTTGQSLKSGGGGGNDYIKNIGKYIGYYQAQLNKANKELKTLNTGKGGTQKQMKANYGGDGHENIAQISYKKGKKSKEEYVNLASYIKAENGTYVVDQKALNKEKNVEKRKAIADAANKEINDRLSKKYKAEDEIEKANEALKKMGEELYETFFKWENELTKIWNITQKIEQAQSRMSRNDAYGDLLKAQLSTGKLKGGQGSAQKDLANFRNKLKSQNQLLQNRQQAITESKKALQHLLTSDEEKATLAEVNSKLNKDNQATAKANKKAELDKAKQAKKNYDAAVKNRATTQSKLNSVNSKIAKLEKKRKKSKKEKQELKNLKAQRTTYQNQIANYNKTISANKSLAGQVNKLQKEYNGMASGTALSATQRAGYEQYKKELQNQIAAEDLGRKYTTITKRADGTIDVQFNTEAFEKARLNGDITNDMAKAVQDWVKKIQEASANLQENYENLIKDVTEYYTQLESLQDEWANYGKELTEITEDAEKQKIDKVKQLYDGVKKALDKLLDEVKRKLDERRKQEENAKTERDISQKQQRLAMLRADTSGGHQVEIAQLEQEIAEAQQNYQNSLEDQLVDKLQQQADLAAEQRERQIEIQEALATSVNNIEKVNEWMANPAAYEDEIRKAYYAKNNYDNVTNAEQAQIETDFNEFYNGLLTNQTKQEELIKQIDSIQSIVAEIEKALTLQNQTLETAKADGYTAKQAQSQFNASLSDLRTVGKYTFDDFVKSGYTNAQIKQAGFGAAEFKSRGISYANAKAAGYSLDELEKGGYAEATKEKAKIAADKAAAAKAAAAKAAAAKAAAEKAAAEKAKKDKALNTYNTTLKAAHKKGTVTASQLKTLFSAGDILKYSRLKVMDNLASGDGSGGVTWKEVLKAAKSAGYSGKTIKGYLSSNLTDTRKKAFESVYGKWSKFATGGLASFTGPAWLDGTPSKPELVLNARDTKNFIMLKDVLSKAMDSSGGLSGFGGAAYEININVDHINSDYDVDKIAKRVKENIVKDSGYRNVTQVRKFR